MEGELMTGESNDLKKGLSPSRSSGRGNFGPLYLLPDCLP